jgi:uncharacterized protein (DUF58 family)
MAIISTEILKNVRQIQIKTNRTVSDLLAGAYHSAFKGHGMEFEDVREYLPGDEIRSIDWNVTARMDQPYVKNFREERELTVMLIVDVSASGLFGVTGKQKNELIAEIGAVLAFSAIQNNDKVGLVLFSDVVEKYIPPQKGQKHGLRVIRELLAFEPKHSGTNINEAIKFLANTQKRKGICFLISDFLMELSKQEINSFAKRHELISICLTDPREWVIPNIGLFAVKDLETGEKVLVDSKSCQQLAQYTQNKIENNKKLMHKIGAGFIHIRTDQPYTKPIRDYFRVRECRR